jgi:hypothetical protein
MEDKNRLAIAKEKLQKAEALKKGASVAKMLIKRLALALLAAVIIVVVTTVTDPALYERGGQFFTLNRLYQALTLVALVFIMLLTVRLYGVFNKNWDSDGKFVNVLLASIVVTHIFAVLFARFVNVYVAPLILAPLLVVTLLEGRGGILVNVLVSLTFFLTHSLFAESANLLGGAIALFVSVVSGVFLTAIASKASSRLQFTLASLAVAVASFVMSLLTHVLVRIETYFIDILAVASWSFFATILSSALYLMVLPFFEQVFKVVTNYRVAEIASLNSPLLKRLSEEAPGTFNHSLLVGSLAEACAAAIGENPTLAKTAAYYHDIGKVLKPDYFVENQQGYNPHDDIIPEISVNIITNHPEDGYKLIKQARLPDFIAEVAREHHGNAPVGYFLYKAQNLTEQSVDKEEFSYPYPKPTSKIAAIIMIADTVEAACRAMSKNAGNNDFNSLIHKLIQEKVSLGQFDNCGLTFRDLKIIENTLSSAVANMYHSRVQYPK